MSGPVEVVDVERSDQGQAVRLADAPVVTESRLAQVGSLQVRRALPTLGRRAVGPWCFADHFGPAEVNEHPRPDIGPHPHMGLQTVTWLLDGELMHRDSLGSEQAIRPGQLNLMTAGLGVAHAEEGVTGYRGPIHGIQLWVAQPSATRDAPPAFEHHAELPKVEFSGGVGTVLVGEVAGASSPARRDTEHVGLDLNLHPGDTSIPLDRSYEYAVVVTIGTVTIPGQTVGPGHLVYLGSGRDQLDLHIDDAGRALLLGGVPCAEPLLMWWNFVARTRDEVEVAYEDWASDSGRFGMVDSSLPRIETTRPVWRPPTR